MIYVEDVARLISATQDKIIDLRESNSCFWSRGSDL